MNLFKIKIEMEIKRKKILINNKHIHYQIFTQYKNLERKITDLKGF